MKKLIYVLFVLLTTQYISSQRMQESLVELSKPDYSMSEGTIGFSTPRCCYCGIGVQETFNMAVRRMEQFIKGFPVDMHAYRTFGTITPKWEPVFIHPDVQVSSINVRSTPSIFIDGIETAPKKITVEQTSPDVESVCIILGGIPGQYYDISDLSEKEQHEVLFKQQSGVPVCNCNEMTLVGNTDVQILSTEEMGDSEKSTQGPFTGLEGHNFTEKPAIVYPNPVQNILHIKSTDPITVIEILNIHGESLKIFYNNEIMDVSELAAGTYYARISFENIKQVQVEKILIVK